MSGNFDAVIVDTRVKKGSSERMRWDRRVVDEECRNAPSLLDLPMAEGAYVICNLTKYYYVAAAEDFQLTEIPEAKSSR